MAESTAKAGRGHRPIVTITLNPALDVSTSVDVVTPEHKLRCSVPVREPGGGGINVARVAGRLGADVTAIVVAGGAVGHQLVSLMETEGLRARPVGLAAETRQSFSVAERSTDRQFRFVLPGSAIDRATLEAVIEEFRHLPQRSADPLVVISGSVAPETGPGIMEQLVAGLQPADVIVDTSGPALLEALRCPLLLVKPSARELASVVGRPLVTEADVLDAAREAFADAAVGALLVSVGAGGAMLITGEEKPVRLRAPTVRVRSAVGAGDSLVGGIVVGLARGYDLRRAATLGVAAGTAAVLTDGSELCARADVDELLPLVATEEIRANEP